MGIPFLLDPISTSWYPLVIAQTIMEDVKTSSAERLTTEQVQILHACTQSIVGGSNTSGRDAGDDPLSGPWLELFAGLKDFVFVALCDSQAAVSAAGILSGYLFGSNLRDSLLKDSRFSGSLRLLYPATVPSNADAATNLSTCQVVFESFIKDVFASGSPYDNIVVGVVNQFSKSFPSQYAQYSGLQKTLKEMNNKMR
jgi:hypothetical protein